MDERAADQRLCGADAGGIKIFRVVSKSPLLSVIISENEWEVLTVTKYYISLEADGNFHIIEYDTGEGVRVLRDAGGRETSVVIYHNSLIVSALYDTVEAAIKHLGGSRRETILPDGRVVIPESVNYPELAIRNIFVPFSAVRAEVWPGEPGWGK